MRYYSMLQEGQLSSFFTLVSHAVYLFQSMSQQNAAAADAGLFWLERYSSYTRSFLDS